MSTKFPVLWKQAQFHHFHLHKQARLYLVHVKLVLVTESQQCHTWHQGQCKIIHELRLSAVSFKVVGLEGRREIRYTWVVAQSYKSPSLALSESRSPLVSFFFLILLKKVTRYLTNLRKDRLALSQTVAPSQADPI